MEAATTPPDGGPPRHGTMANNHEHSPRRPREAVAEQAHHRVLAMIMAGGRGERLMPMTDQRSKPAVPFAGAYRIIDFALSNFLNSGVLAMYVLVQYRSQSLIEHLRRAWRVGGLNRQTFITAVPPQMKGRGKWYEGTADAVYQNLNLIRDFAPHLVAVFGADHIYRMDLRQMIRFHADRRADATVAALPVPLPSARRMGIIQTDAAQRITNFEEKPRHPSPMPDNPKMAFSSMGNYLFNADVLIGALERDAKSGGSHDFGRDLIPSILTSHNVMAYNFLDNVIPGIHPHEEWGYWRDVGTLSAYWHANMDLLGERPAFDLHNVNWPILTDTSGAPAASIVRSRLDDTLVGQGSLVVNAHLKRSVLGRNVSIGDGADIEECVILDGTVIGANVKLKGVIADRFNLIPSGTVLGHDPAHDNGLSYVVDRSGLIVLPRGHSYGDRAVPPAPG